MIIDNYIEMFDFDFSYLNDFKPEFVKQYIENVDASKGYNVLYKNDALDRTKNIFEECVKDNFKVSEKLNPPKAWLYCQNNKSNFNILHNHIRTASVNGVIYISPPEDNGGELFYLDETGTAKILKVEENKLYLFPGWMLHKPEPQQSPDWRVCINIEYLCSSRPLSLATNLLW